MIVLRVLSFVIDAALILFFLQPIRNTSDPESARRLAAYGSLLCLLLLYVQAGVLLFEPSANIPSVITRYAYRILCIFGYIRFRKDLSLPVALFDAIFAASLLTSCSNIFACPLLLPIHNFQLAITGNSTLDPFLCLLLKESCFFLLFWCTRHYCAIEKITTVHSVRIVFSVLIITCNVFVRATIIRISDAQIRTQVELSLYEILLQVFIIAFYIYYERFMQEHLEKTAIAQQELMNRLQLEAVSAQEKSDQDLRKLRHDMKNHLVAIRQYIGERDTAKADEYIRSLLSDVSSYRIHYQTGNRVLDALLSTKLASAESKHITSTVLVDFSTVRFISDPDICTIFGNALDNAIEACSEITSAEDRFIGIRSAITAGQLVIVISNSSLPRSRSSDSLYRTSKKDSLNHGFGLGNIEHAVNRYNGSVKADYEDGIFTLYITIPVEEDK